MRAFLFGLATVALISTPVAAQRGSGNSAVPLPSASAAQSRPPSVSNVLQSGAAITLVTREELSTMKKKLRVGQTIEFEVADDVARNGVTVIPAGTIARAELTKVGGGGMMGGPPTIAGRLLHLQFGERQIRLKGTFDDKTVTAPAGKGGARGGGSLMGGLLGGMAMAAGATIPAGSTLMAVLDEDVPY